jgi:hypothetical protein
MSRSCLCRGILLERLGLPNPTFWFNQVTTARQNRLEHTFQFHCSTRTYCEMNLSSSLEYSFKGTILRPKMREKFSTNGKVALSTDMLSQSSASRSGPWDVRILPSSFVKDVTDFPSSPQGTMCSNHLRSLLQLRANPWEVMYRDT